MAQSLPVNFVENIIHERSVDIAVLVIDDDNTSNASLSSMLEKFSYKVTCVKVASEVVSMIEKQKDIGLVIANSELLHIDSHSFLTALFEKDIPLILITPEIITKKTSDLLTKATRFCLKKPILENDIEIIWQHMLSKKNQFFDKINIAEKQNTVTTEVVKQIETFRKIIKRQRTSQTSQASLLGRRNFMKPFTTSEMFQKIKNVEWKTKAMCPFEIEKNGRHGNKVETNVGRRYNLWTFERHMKFLAALSILGEKGSRPKSILRIMNDPNLTGRQVSSHLQNYKAQVKRINETLPKNEWKSTEKIFQHPSNYEFPFKPSNLRQKLIDSSSLWYFLTERKSSSSSNVQFFFKKPSERNEKTPNLYLGGNLDLSTPSLVGNILNKSSIESYSTTSNIPPYNIPSINDVNHSGLASTSFSSDKLPDPSGLVSSVGVFNTNTFPMETTMMHFPNSDPKSMQSTTSVLETDWNPLDMDSISILNTYYPQADVCDMGEKYFLPNYTMNPLDTNIDQIGSIPSTEENSHHKTNMNHMDLIHSIESYVHPETDMNIISLETNINQTRKDFSREGHVSSENAILSNISHKDGVSSRENHALDTNTTQVGLVPRETGHTALNNMPLPETNRVDTGLVFFEEGDDVPIEDLISFDSDNEMDIDYWSENCDASEKNIHSATNNLGNDFVSHTPVNSITQIPMEGQDNLLAMHEREGMILNSIEKILNED